MSIEFSFYNQEGAEVGHRSIVKPGETKTILALARINTESEQVVEVVIEDGSFPPKRDVRVYQGTCYENNQGGEFTEYHVKDRDQSYEWEVFQPANEFILGTHSYTVDNGEAGQVQFSSDSSIVVFHHSSDSERTIPPAFLK